MSALTLAPACFFATLMRDGLVGPGATRPSGGRPQQLYLLTDVGKEAFPRHYSWFAQLLINAMAREHGTAGLRARLGRIASAVVVKESMAICEFLHDSDLFKGQTAAELSAIAKKIPRSRRTG